MQIRNLLLFGSASALMVLPLNSQAATEIITATGTDNYDSGTVSLSISFDQSQLTPADPNLNAPDLYYLPSSAVVTLSGQNIPTVTYNTIPGSFDG